MESLIWFLLACCAVACLFGVIYAVRNKNSPTVGHKSHQTVKRCVILPIGLGGSGKTTLAQYLSGNPHADPSRRTEGFHIYKAVNETGNYQRPGQKFIFEKYIIDYTGQNPSLLVAEFARISKSESSGIVRIGNINCLIFVIDLVKPPQNPGDIVARRDFADRERVRKQVDEWSDNAIALLFGLLARETLKYVCIFLNKADLLIEPDARDEAISQISALKGRIQERHTSNDFEFEVIVGSIDKGDGLNQLRRKLDEHSVEI